MDWIGINFLLLFLEIKKGVVHFYVKAPKGKAEKALEGFFRPG